MPVELYLWPRYFKSSLLENVIIYTVEINLKPQFLQKRTKTKNKKLSVDRRNSKRNWGYLKQKEKPSKPHEVINVAERQKCVLPSCLSQT